MKNPELTDALYQILDDAADELREAGFEPGPAAYRAMICYATDRLHTQLCPHHLRDDLTRFQRMLGNMIADLGEQQH